MQKNSASILRSVKKMQKILLQKCIQEKNAKNSASKMYSVKKDVKISASIVHSVKKMLNFCFKGAFS